VRGTAAQEEFFNELWFAYYLNQGAPGSVDGKNKSRRWQLGMAVIAATAASYEAALRKAHLDIWTKK
jgi:hypothetical protein